MSDGRFVKVSIPIDAIRNESSVLFQAGKIRMRIGKVSFFSLSFLPLLLCAGCAIREGEPHPVSWWILGGLGLIVLAGAVIGLLGIRKFQRRLDQIEANLKERASQTEQQRKELDSLYRADDELRRHLHLDDVLQSLVKTAVELLHADKGSLMVWDERGEKLHARAAYGFHPETVAGMSFTPGQGLAGRVALTGEPEIVEDTQLNGRVTPFIIESEGLRALMQVPIRVAGKVYGVFSADYLQPHHFPEEEKRLLTAFAQRAGLAIEMARLHEREEQIAVMQERNRLARDLHDSVTQSMYGVALYTEVAAQLFKSGEVEKAGESLQELKGMALDALAEMRLLIYELRPSAFEQEGLAAALRARLDAVEGRLGLKTNLVLEGEISLPLKVEEGLYRIAQEALHNVLKHAHAKVVTVTLARDKHRVRLEVADDGVGFDPVQACAAGCMGLRGMKERAQELGAEFEIQSQVGGGSKIIVRKPIP
jgi:signal transduction histidine kinase